MAARIHVHHGIIPTIDIEVKAADGFGIGVFYAIAGDKPTGFGIVIAGLQKVKSGFFVEVVSAVTEGVQVCKSYVVFACDFRLMVAPCIVLVFYHNITGVVNKGKSKTASDSSLAALCYTFLPTISL